MRETSGAVKYYNLTVNEYKLVPDVITLNTIINTHAQVGNIEGAVYYYNQFYNYKIKPDLVTMNVMINAYAQAGDVVGAVEQYSQIQSGTELLLYNTTTVTNANMNIISVQFETRYNYNECDNVSTCYSKG